VYLTDEVVAAVEERYGRPRVERWEVPVTAEELAMVRASMKRDRAHDVTLFIFGPDSRLAVIRKPSFPEGAYRAPSGGLRPGEDFTEGALREAREETGLRVTLERYLLRVHARFIAGGEAIPWTTHILSAFTRDTCIVVQDTREIREARWATLAELQGPIRQTLLAAERPLLRYRVRLTDAAVEELARLRGERRSRRG